jgi:hypothetical protein
MCIAEFDHMHTNSIFRPATFFIVTILLSAVMGCKNDAKLYTNPPGYNFSQPILIKLPGEMNEISGIAYYQRSNSIVAECDGKGCIYKVSLNNVRRIGKWKFGKGKDYEDILLVDSNFYLLKSDGNISKLSFTADNKIYLYEYPFADSVGNEFESMYYNDSLQRIIFFCKKCQKDTEDSISSYAFNIQDGQYAIGPSISLAGIEKALSSEKNIKVRPSATAIHPMTGELYVLSSIDKLLVIVDKNYRFKEAYKLDSKKFKQPEGITFTPNGDLFISNEGADVGYANILLFPYKSIPHK